MNAAEGFSTPSADQAAAHQRISAFIDTLPQAPHIAQATRQQWIDSTIRLGDHDPMWHAKRLRGIGSSEIGCCVMTARGEYVAFQGARDVVLSKLMRLAPDAGTGHTRRGNAMEDVIRQMFHQQFGTRSETAMMKAMGDVVVSQHPWMVGNPDDLCIIDRCLYIVDYKAPTAETISETKREEGVKFEYVCQLHHLQAIGRAGGLKIGGRLLCSLDYNDWTLDVRDVAHDQALLEEMLAVGDELWNEFVLKGDVPAVITQPLYSSVSADDLATLTDLAERLVVLKAAGAKALELADDLFLDMAAIAKKYNFDGAKIALPGGAIKTKQKLDTDMLKALCQRHSLHDDVSTPDAVAQAMAALTERGEPQERYMLSTPSFSLSRAQKGASFELIQGAREAATGVLLSHLESHVAQLHEAASSLPAVRPNAP